MALDFDLEPTDKKPVSVLGWIWRGLVGLIVAASFGVWVYAYSGMADRPAPDLLADTSVATSAETICASALEDVDAMPSATAATSPAERAEQIQNSTARFQTMLNELSELTPTGEGDDVIWSGFLGDWQLLLGDRLTYADAIAEDPEAQLLLTAIDGERLDRRIKRVALTNAMTSCQSPTDV